MTLHEDDQRLMTLDDEVDEGFLSGVVIEVAANRCQVLVDSEMLDCSYRRVMLKHESAFTNLAAVGDDVLVSEIEPGVGVVEKVLPRRNMLARIHRPDVGKTSSQRKVIAANIDRVLVVASWRNATYLAGADRPLPDRRRP